jgi:hypothetical protein
LTTRNPQAQSNTAHTIFVHYNRQVKRFSVLFTTLPIAVIAQRWVVCFGKWLSTTGRDSAVGIATRSGLDGPGIESQWGRAFPHPSRPALGPT